VLVIIAHTMELADKALIKLSAIEEEKRPVLQVQTSTFFTYKKMALNRVSR